MFRLCQTNGEQITSQPHTQLNFILFLTLAQTNSALRSPTGFEEVHRPTRSGRGNTCLLQPLGGVDYEPQIGCGTMNTGSPHNLLKNEDMSWSINAFSEYVFHMALVLYLVPVALVILTGRTEACRVPRPGWSVDRLKSSCIVPRKAKSRSRLSDGVYWV